MQAPGAADDSEHGSNQPEPVVWIRSGQNFQDPGYPSAFGQQPSGYAPYPSPAARNSRPRGVMVVALVMLTLIVALVFWLTFLS